jgi:hypothetical protein
MNKYAVIWDGGMLRAARHKFGEEATTSTGIQDPYVGQMIHVNVQVTLDLQEYLGRSYNLRNQRKKKHGK